MDDLKTVVELNFTKVQPDRKSQAAWKKFGTIGYDSYVAFLRYGKPVAVELETVGFPV
jgi:hypothetical protein